MHTVRNRVASRPRPPRASAKGKVPRSTPGALHRREPAFLLRQPNPPAFPEYLILPAPRGAVISTLPWPEPPAAAAPKKRRKAAKGKGAASRRSQPMSSQVSKSQSASRKTAVRKSPSPRKAPKIQVVAKASAETPPSEAPVAMTTIDLIDRALAMEPELPAPLPQPVSATASATVADSRPLPRSQTPMLLRGSGFFDLIVRLFSGLATWRSTRRQSARDRTRLVRANARQRAMQSQNEALEALKAQTKS